MQASEHIPQSQLQPYSTAQPSSTPVVNDQASRISSYQNPIKSEFGKIKGIEVLSFKEAELETTLGGVTKFNMVGILSVLYFENYDRFVLSLKDWKYALLKRLPVTASEFSNAGPVSYTFPTYNGFYTLTIPKIQHVEGLKNLETIFINNSRFSYKGMENLLMGGRSPDDQFRSMELTPREMGTQPSPMMGTQPSPMMGTQPSPIMGTQPSPMGEQQPGTMMGTQPSPMGTQSLSMGEQQPGTMSQSAQLGESAPNLSRGQRMKRGFKKFGHMFTGMSKKEKLNLNNYQARDFETLKATNEVMAPYSFYPRREVERWITYNKEIANGLGYVAEGYQEGANSIMGESRMRGYGSVDLGQGTLSNPIPLGGGISTSRPSLEDTGYSTGQLHSVPAGTTVAGYSKIRWTDKLKSKIPGEHRYYGEKIPGEISHSHSIHPTVTDRLGQSLGTTPTNPTPGMIGESYTQAFGKEVSPISPMGVQSTGYVRPSEQMTIRPIGEAYAHSFGQQPEPIIQSSDYQRDYEYTEPTVRTGESYQTTPLRQSENLEEARIINEQFPSTIQPSAYERTAYERGTMVTRPIGETYIHSMEHPTSLRQAETYPATIRASENIKYSEPVTITESYQPQSFGETPGIRQEGRYVEEKIPSTIQSSTRTAGFIEPTTSLTSNIESATGEREQTFQRTMTPVGETFTGTYVEPSVLNESENLPTLAQRIRAGPSKPSLVESTEPSFLQRMKNMFSGGSQPETTTTQAEREIIREPVIESQMPMSEMDIIRGQNAHYQG